MTVGSTTDLKTRLDTVLETIERSAARAGRRPEDVTLVAVSKTQAPEAVAALVEAGVRHFGENRVQEAAAKVPLVAERTDLPLTWHLVGTLQSNKIRAALGLFAIFEAVDGVRIAEAIDARVEAGRRWPVLLEVYFGDDPARPGFRPAELRAALERIARLPRLEVQGLMTVAPLGLDEADTRAVFARLRELREQAATWDPSLSLRHLSMGMTDDYPLAIEEGATMVRVGRALFGARRP